MRIASVLLLAVGAQSLVHRHLPALRPARVANTFRLHTIVNSQEQDQVATDETTELGYTPLDVEVSDFDEYLIKMGVKEDPRIPEECRVDTMTKIKSAGTAGIVSYALTEGAFWVISIPLAYSAVFLSTGSFPDTATPDGKMAVTGFSVTFLTFARLVVPLRIAFALAL